MFPEALQHIDEQWLRLINQTWSNALFDKVMPPVRDKYFWVPLYVIIAALMVWKFRIQGLVLIAIVLINFAISDQLSSAVIKPHVGRIRPCNDPEVSTWVMLRVDACGVGKSFTSSHATNTFALAVILTLLFRKRSKWIGPLIFFWAALVSYAQIYVGVHYPIDVIGGALLGSLISIFIYYLARKFILPRYVPEL